MIDINFILLWNYSSCSPEETEGDGGTERGHRPPFQFMFEEEEELLSIFVYILGKSLYNLQSMFVSLPCVFTYINPPFFFFSFNSIQISSKFCFAKVYVQLYISSFNLVFVVVVASLGIRKYMHVPATKQNYFPQIDSIKLSHFRKMERNKIQIYVKFQERERERGNESHLFFGFLSSLIDFVNI